ncbi:MAG: glycerol-3-phosphate dehydrogenase [Anaerolineae bacterium]|nr:glycerol-3-phosphate dehydrogenase [Anaerolineae bacterium]
MAVVTILGAGYMGAALSFPALENDHEVRLWGTWLDDPLIDAVRIGHEHPRLEMAMLPALQTYKHKELAQALDGADLLICAVTSEGIARVMQSVLMLIDHEIPFMSATKGLLPGPNGHMDRLSRTVEALALTSLHYGQIGGPSKAVELCRRIPTAVVYAGAHAAFAADIMHAPYYHITLSEDLPGVEVCAALKNAFAIGSGLFDGLEKAGAVTESYNAKSAFFSKAVHEIARVVEAMGGQPETAFGLAGAGDLIVTAVAGRNRTFGEMVGAGTPPDEVAAYMAARNLLTEGYPAVRTGWALVSHLAGEGRLDLEDFAFLRALYAIVYEGAPVKETLFAIDLRERRLKGADGRVPRWAEIGDREASHHDHSLG